MAYLNLPGLLIEPMPSGVTRYRVRVEGERTRRVLLKCGPDHPQFMEAYIAARAGTQIEPRAITQSAEVTQSLTWLIEEWRRSMITQVQSGEISATTLNQRTRFLRLAAEHPSSVGPNMGEFDCRVPKREWLLWLDTMADRPGARKNAIGAVRAMFRWAIDREIVTDNPAADIPMTYRSRGGAKPWSVGDLRQFRTRHPPGSDAHLALTLFMFTAARVSDAILLGRDCEVQRDGITWLKWQPEKRGSSEVTIPILPPLMRAIRAKEIEHLSRRYLLTTHGRPWRTTDSFRNSFKRWCVECGLPDRSPHGIRKAAGHLLAEAGATQHQIMAVHGHTQAQTSEIYTRGVQRSKLAESAIQLLSGMEW